MKGLILLPTLILAAFLIGGHTAPRAQNPCEREPTWQMAPPRIGYPQDFRRPLACIEIDGVLRCE